MLQVEVGCSPVMADQTSSSPFALPFGAGATPQQVLVVYTYYHMVDHPSNMPARTEMVRIYDHGVQAQLDHHIVAIDNEPWSPQKLDEAWIQSLKQRIENVPRRPRGTEPATIFRVPGNIREADHQAYQPRMVSIGPYHRGDPLLQAVEQLKWHYLRDFLSRNPGGGLEGCVRRLILQEARARDAYFEELKMNTRDFVEMLLLDGCFVVELFLKRYDGEGAGSTEYVDLISGNQWALSLLMVDLLMLENQLPFFVLQLLYDTVAVDMPLSELAFLCLQLDDTIPMNKDILSEGSKFHHLLHLFHSSIIPVKPKDCSERRPHLLHRQFTYAKSFLSGLRRRSSLSSLCKLRFPVLRRRRKRPPEPDQGSISCATQLKEAGIKFRRKTNASSVLDVTFRGGHIEMPVVGLFDITNYLLRNMIAFEQCYPGIGNDVTTFATLLDCIIDTPADVALLQSKGVIINGLGNDDAAAKLFNGLCREVSADFEDTYLTVLVKAVNKHCSFKLNRWRAKLNHDYFNNPWSAISVCGAVVLLFLTFVQTFFSLLSYLHPGR